MESQGQKIAAVENQIVVLDCHYPHTYYCDTSTDFLWFHVTGNNSGDYAELLYEKSGMLFEGDHIYHLKLYFESILAGAQAPVVNELGQTIFAFHIPICGRDRCPLRI